MSAALNAEEYYQPIEYAKMAAKTRQIRIVKPLEPYASLIGCPDNFNPDPIWQEMQKWLQDLRRSRPIPRYRGQFTKY